MGYEGNDRRRHPRFPFVKTVELKIDGSWQECTAMDIAFGGIFVSTEHPPPTGTPVVIRFAIDGKEQPLQLKGMVVRCALEHGAGIGFGDLDEEDRSVLSELLRMLEQTEG